MTAPTITQLAYTELQRAFDFYNAELFANAIPRCLITYSRRNRTYGYFAPRRWAEVREDQAPDIPVEHDEISMNPTFFAYRSIGETLSTMVHEMVHAWQAHHGTTGARGYHNRQWADKMESVGLIPSHTGQPGGKRLGFQMTHYVQPDGPFARATAQLLASGFQISYYDRLAFERNKGTQSVVTDDDQNVSLIPVEPLTEPPKKKPNRVKFICIQCGYNVRGVRKLEGLVGCMDCMQPLTVEEP